jgi:hypothetical protein
MSQENVETFRRGFAAVNHGDLDGFLAWRSCARPMHRRLPGVDCDGVTHSRGRGS